MLNCVQGYFSSKFIRLSDAVTIELKFAVDKDLRYKHFFPATR